MNGPGLYEFLIEAELQQYYNSIKNDLKVQNVAQLKYVSEDDMNQIGMSRPETRRLKKYFNKHCPQTYLAKMKKKLLSRADNPTSVASLTSNSQNISGKSVRNVAPGRHIIQAESIVIHKTLGSGEFGTVQQGVWTSDDGQRIQVAIKCLSQERMENNPVEFLKEAAIMHTVDHEHVVRLYGVVLDTAALMLVTELAPLRSLLECLKEPSMRPNLSVPTLCDFAVQICDGMQYLESKRLIHRDLAARNILVFSRSKVKISDFGLSRALGVGKDYYQTNFNVNLKLPIAWCAPECINFLRFTSASDVWAYGVTLWEMFSYGFQPWAALTGQQILEAIDEPNYQRLEKPECCPHEIYYQVMLKCWQHEPQNRPTFVQLSNLLPECKPEQVQAIRESETRARRDFLLYDVGDIITVLDKKPAQGSEEGVGVLWKGVLNSGKSGLFNPANTITYLGSSLPSVKQSQSPFHRNDSRNSSLRKGRLSVDMISGPQGDLKHTGHVGPDGQFFGDITFLGSKCWVPRQVVSPYKPESVSSDISGASTPVARFQSQSGSSSSSKCLQDPHEIPLSDTAPLLSTAAQMNTDGSSSGMRRRMHLNAPVNMGYGGTALDPDHEYHEISDEENEMMARGGNGMAIGLSNPALSSKSQSPLESPRFEKSFDLDMGPSLIDEVFGALQQEQPDDAHNVKNELREMARSKKKFSTVVKPISSSDRRTLDQAIAIANELASRSMLDLDRPGKHSNTNNSLDDISSPRTPNSPTHRRKFSFILGSGKSERERRNYSQEAASIPDIQSTLTEEAKEAYNSLVEKPSMGSLGFLTPSYENKSMSFHFPEKSSSASKKSELFESPDTTMSPSSMSSTSNSVNGFNFSHSTFTSPRKSKQRTLSLTKNETDDEEEEIDGNPLRLLRQNKASAATNVLPLPPRERGRGSTSSNGSTTRHQRKHPLLIPAKIPLSLDPPPPPPKPIRQHLPSPQQQQSSSSSLSTRSTPEKETNAGARMQTTLSQTPQLTDVAQNSLEDGSNENISSITAQIQTILHNNNSDTESCPDTIPPPPPTTTATIAGETKKVETYRSMFTALSPSEVPLYENFGNSSTTTNENESQSSFQPSINNHSSSNSNGISRSNSNAAIIDEDSSTVSQQVEIRSTKISSSNSSASSISVSSTNGKSGNSIINSSNCSSSNVYTESVPSVREVIAMHSRSNSASSASTDFSVDKSFKKLGSNPATGSFEASSSVKILEDKTNIRKISSIVKDEDLDQDNANKVNVAPSVAPRSIFLSTREFSPAKVKTVQRVLGSTTSVEDCGWALDATNGDSAHAVKLLRLKALLPESLLVEDVARVVSVLEMSHWDVARASAFLLNNPKSSKRCKIKTRSELLAQNSNSNHCEDISNNNSLGTSSSSSATSEINISSESKRDYIRPTRV